MEKKTEVKTVKKPVVQKKAKVSKVVVKSEPKADRKVKILKPGQSKAVVVIGDKEIEVKYYLRRNHIPTIGVPGSVAIDLDMWLKGKAEL